MSASDWSVMPMLTSDWLTATEATEATAVMENTVSMDTAEAMDMAGEIVINILINLMPYLINNDGEFKVITKQYLIDTKLPHYDDYGVLNYQETVRMSHPLRNRSP